LKTDYNPRATWLAPFLWRQSDEHSHRLGFTFDSSA
jgi:hypothetical protein